MYSINPLTYSKHKLGAAHGAFLWLTKQAVNLLFFELEKGEQCLEKRQQTSQ